MHEIICIFLTLRLWKLFYKIYWRKIIILLLDDIKISDHVIFHLIYDKIINALMIMIDSLIKYHLNLNASTYSENE
jgi:uncharacterized membrane protein